VVRDVGGNVLPDGSTLKPGQQLNVEGDGYAPVSTVDAVIASTPTTVAAAQVDASGHVSLVAVLPTNLPAGTHTLTVSGAGSSAVFRFTVAATTGGTSDPATSTAGNAGSGTALPFTGTNATALSLTGFGLVGAGACALAAARRFNRRPSRRH
jgi:titin